MNYFLQIDGIDGGSAAKGVEGAFDGVQVFDYQIDSLITLLRGEREIIDADFSPLDLSLDLNAGLTHLLDSALNGTTLGPVRLVGVTEGDRAEIAFELRLGDAVVSKVEDGIEADQLSLDFKAISVSVWDVLADGRRGQEHSFSWDLVEQQPLAAEIPKPDTAGGEGTPGGHATKFFLFVEGLNGGSTARGAERAFEITDYSLSATLEELAAVTHGEGTGGTASLAVNLEISDGLTGLFANAAAGHTIPAVRLVGMSDDGRTLTPQYDLHLGGVVITTFEQGGNSASLEFAFEALELTTTGNDDSKAGGHDAVFSWNVPESGIPDVTPSSRETGGEAERYFLYIDGVRGDSTAKGFEGAFEIDAHQLALNTPVSFDAEGNIVAGPTDFSSLRVDLDLTEGLSPLLGTAAQGELLRSVRLVGVVENDGARQTSYDLSLGNVHITEIKESSDGDTLAFDFGQILLKTWDVKPDGNLSAPHEFNWDVVGDHPGDTAITKPDIPTHGTGGAANQFFLLVQDVNGGSKVRGFEGAFEIDGYNLDVEIAHLQGRAGRPDFSDLEVELSLGDGLTTLLSQITEGRPIESVSLVGVQNSGSGGAPLRTFELRLGDAHISALRETNGTDSVSFAYERLVLTTHDIDTKGNLSVPHTFSWDLTTGETDASVSQTTPSGSETGGAATRFYLLLEGIDGGVNLDFARGAFEVESHQFNVDLVTDTGIGGSAGRGRPDFSNLSVSLSLDDGLTQLLHDTASGELIHSVRLIGVTSGDRPEITYDLRLAEATVAAVNDTLGGNDSLEFAYYGFSLTTRNERSDGSLASPTTFNWNIETGETGGAIDLPEIPTSGTTGGGGERFFLYIDGLIGDSTVRGFQGAFDVEDYAISIGNNTETGAFTRFDAEVSPLAIRFATGGDLAALLEHAAGGEVIRSIRLVGVSGGERGQTVFDLKLGDVLISQVQGNQDGEDFAFDFRQIHLTTWELEEGRRGDPHVFSWDFSRRTDQTDIPDPNSNAAPVAVGDTASAGENEARQVNVLANDSDPDTGDTLHLASLGTVTVSSSNTAIDGLNAGAAFSLAGNQIAFAPGTLFDALRQGESALVTVSYLAADEAGLTAQANLALTVLGSNDGPTVAGRVDLGSATGSGAVLITREQLLANASDADWGDTLDVLGLSVTAGSGSLSDQGNGTWLFTPATGFVGAAALSYQVSDGTAQVADGADLQVYNPIVALSGQAVVRGTASADMVIVDRSNANVDTGSGDDTLVVDPTPRGDIYHALSGGSGNDTLDLSGFASPVMVNLQVGRLVGLDYGVANLRSIENVIGGSGDDYLVGGAGANRLEGRDGNDKLLGGAGNDVLVGGRDDDLLIGGGGDDHFVFGPDFGEDRIIDFNLGTLARHDTLDLRGLGFASRAEVLAHTDGGGSAVIHAGDDSITLQGVSVAQLSAADHWLLL